MANSPRCGEILCKQYHWGDVNVDVLLDMNPTPGPGSVPSEKLIMQATIHQWYCLHRISPHRGEFATFAKTVAIRGDFMLKCGKWRILLDQRWDREVLGTSLVIAGEVKWMANSHIGPNFLISYWEEHVGPNKQISEVQASRIVTWHPTQGLNPWPPWLFKIWRRYIPTNTYPHKPLV